MKDALGDRMKQNYEDVWRVHLPRRIPMVLRVDGRAFHTLTQRLERPFDRRFSDAMERVALSLCKEIQGAQFAYTQSDEVSVLIHNYKKLDSSAWFDNNLAKMTSVAASLASVTFDRYARSQGVGFLSMEDQVPTFDARVFVIPETEVCNYFIWRMGDAERNSLNALAQKYFSPKQLKGKKAGNLHDALHEIDVNWNDLPVRDKRGSAIIRVKKEIFGGGVRYHFEVASPPIFTQYRNYIEKYLELEPEVIA